MVIIIALSLSSPHSDPRQRLALTYLFSPSSLTRQAQRERSRVRSERGPEFLIPVQMMRKRWQQPSPFWFGRFAQHLLSVPDSWEDGWSLQACRQHGEQKLVQADQQAGCSCSVPMHGLTTQADFSLPQNSFLLLIRHTTCSHIDPTGSQGS